MCTNYEIAHKEAHNAAHNKSTVDMQYISKEMLFFYLKLVEFLKQKMRK